MGKAARNQAKRRQEAARTAQLAPDDEVLLGILRLENLEAFEQLLDAHPELLSERTEKQLQAYSQSPDFGSTFRVLGTLLREAREERALAFRAFRKAVADARRLGDGLEAEIQTIDKAIDERRFDDALAAIGVAITHARAAGLGVTVGALHDRLGHVYRQHDQGDRADSLERSITAFEQALELTPPDQPRLAADILMHLGLVYAERLQGDRLENVEHAIGALRTSLGLRDEQVDPNVLAMTETNLATALLRREAGDQLENVREAVALCRSALVRRSPENSAVDWAYSQLTLGAALERLVALDASALSEVESVYAEVFSQRDRVTEPWLIGLGHASLGRLYLERTRARAEEIVDAHSAGELEELLGHDRLLALARVELEAALPLICEAPDQIYHGNALGDLADVLAEEGDDEAAIETGQKALAILRPAAAPKPCLDVARVLGFVLARNGRWQESTVAYRDAIAAAELMFHRRLESTSREREIRAIGNLPRWAAFALARTGALREAALVLEGGRTHELRRLFGLKRANDGSLALLPYDLRTAYERAAADLIGAPIGAGGAAAARQFQEVLMAIRGIAGFEDFDTGAKVDDLIGAVEPGWPLVFVNPTPMGTMLLLINNGPDGAPVEHVRFLEEPDSTEIFFRLLAGSEAYRTKADKDEPSRSYLIGISGSGSGPSAQDFPGALDETLQWLGGAVARPIRDLLLEVEATGVSLILCGPIGVTPLHAAVWEDNGHMRCLLDEFDVRFAPSAITATTARRRAAERTTVAPVLVGLGDPTDDLPAAAPEVEEIAGKFADGYATLALRKDATSRFLQAEAPRAHFLHLACHARGGLFDSTESAVLLNDGWLSAFDLTALPMLTTRLVTVSACESALFELAGMPDEVFSLGTAVVAAGSACAIVSLWPVDDAATGLLMVRLYDEILVHGHRPPEALCRAQRWLRDLTRRERDAFLVGHPALEAEVRRRAEGGPSPRHAMGGVNAGDDRPYAHAELWAPFVAVGV